MNLLFPSKLPLISHPTPLQPLSRLQQQLGPDAPTLWMKRDDLTGLLVSGNKVRKLEYTLAKAKALGVDTLITCGGIQSNHCRATAVLGAQLGLKVHLVLRGPEEAMKTGNHLLGALMGATIDVYPLKEYVTDLDAILRQHQQNYAQQGRKAMIIPTGASDGTGVWGYLDAAKELQRDFERAAIQPEYIVCATGSGGTQAGLTLGCHLSSKNAQVMGFAVCDNEAYFYKKVMQDIRDWQADYAQAVDLADMKVLVNDQYIGPGYAKATPEIYACIQGLAKTEGILLDPVYTGKAFYGLLQEIKRGRFKGCSNIVFIHTGGVFGIFSESHLPHW